MASHSYNMPIKPDESSSKSGYLTQTSPSPKHIATQLGIKATKSATPPMTQSTQKKRKAPQSSSKEYDNEDAEFSEDAKPKKKRVVKKKDEEKRLRVMRKKAPLSYLERLSRVRTQRMFLIDRERSMSEDGLNEEEVFDIAGTTGNIYQVKIGRMPSCTCPDNEKGNQCKHIIYVLVNILKVRDDLGYQLAFLTTELAEIFANAPPSPQSSGADTPTSTDMGVSRKPIEGDCPVCVMEFDESDKSEEIVWCKAACGNNIHRHCFEQWARSKPGQVKCVYCRTPWKGDEDSLKRISKGGVKNGEGYVNVASELGLSRERDMSSYHSYWVERQYGGRGYGRYSGY